MDFKEILSEGWIEFHPIVANPMNGREPSEAWDFLTTHEQLSALQQLRSSVKFITSTGIKSKAVPLHAMEALGGRGGIAPTHSRPRH
jgi:hypothetical protein